MKNGFISNTGANKFQFSEQPINMTARHALLNVEKEMENTRHGAYTRRFHTHPLSPCVHSNAGTGHTHSHNELTDIKLLCKEKHFTTAVVLLVGLGIHSFCAGLALGATTKFGDIIALGIGIVCHKYLAAFALGL